MNNLQQLKTKNKKIYHLKRKKPPCNYQLPMINLFQQFPSMFNNVPLSEDEEDVSYDVESLITNSPIKETIDFIFDETYNLKKLKPICKESIFKILLYKLTTDM